MIRLLAKLKIYFTRFWLAENINSYARIDKERERKRRRNQISIIHKDRSRAGTERQGPGSWFECNELLMEYSFGRLEDDDGGGGEIGKGVPSRTNAAQLASWLFMAVAVLVWLIDWFQAQQISEIVRLIWKKSTSWPHFSPWFVYSIERTNVRTFEQESQLVG